MDVRYATRVGRRGAIHYGGVEYPLTETEYDALGKPGAGAPHNPTNLTEAQWQQAWRSNLAVAVGAPSFDTPDGKLAFGDVFIEPETGNLLAKFGLRERVYRAREFTVAAGKLTLTDTRGDIAGVVNDRIVPIIRGGAVAFDATANGKASSGVSSITFSHTCTGSNLALGVGAGSAIGTADPTGVTYNGVAMTKQHSDPLTTDLDNCTIWSLLSPATGANNIVITYAGTGDIHGGSVSATGVGAITGATGAHGTSTSPSVAVTSASGDLVYGHVVAFGNRTTTAGTGETEVYDFVGTMSTLDSHGFYEAGAASVTIAPTLSGSNEWSISAFNFQASASGATSTGAGTFPAFTGSATSTQTQTSTATGTFPKLTGSATGVMLPSSIAAGTFPSLTGSASSTQTQTSTGVGTFPVFTGSASGTHGGATTSTAAGFFPVLAGSAVGNMAPSSTAAGTFPVFVGAAGGAQTQTSTAAGTFPVFVGAAAGTQGSIATAAGTFAALVGAAVGTQTQPATAAGVFPVITGSAVGAMLPSAVGAGVFPALVGLAAASGGPLVAQSPILGRARYTSKLAARARYTATARAAARYTTTINARGRVEKHP